MHEVWDINCNLYMADVAPLLSKGCNVTFSFDGAGVIVACGPNVARITREQMQHAYIVADYEFTACCVMLDYFFAAFENAPAHHRRGCLLTFCYSKNQNRSVFIHQYIKHPAQPEVQTRQTDRKNHAADDAVSGSDDFDS